ncbi:hypothetical protein RvY_03800 [Ramazzottius varieornatus]|uniref:Uncharacterized protein n=1 Tax=Ramazzottius varieornatus TaxID=947166 RepID=A0A1D1UUZ5_RAMVA|nr:hypothetical protein RvY_03800 [Ramazzottius varieornatus]
MSKLKYSFNGACPGTTKQMAIASPFLGACEPSVAQFGIPVRTSRNRMRCLRSKVVSRLASSCLSVGPQAVCLARRQQEELPQGSS